MYDRHRFRFDHSMLWFYVCFLLIFKNYYSHEISQLTGTFRNNLISNLLLKSINPLGLRNIKALANTRFFFFSRRSQHQESHIPTPMLMNYLPAISLYLSGGPTQDSVFNKTGSFLPLWGIFYLYFQKYN